MPKSSKKIGKKTLFITGGHGEIGQAIVARFCAANYEIIAPGSLEMDLSNRNSIENYLKSINAKAGSIDAIIHCAGVNWPKPFEDLAWEDLDKTLQINTTSLVRILQKLAPTMKKNNGGHVLAVSSIYGVISRKNRLPYAMSKHALGGLIQTLAIELGAFNVKVNALAPGIINTKMTTKNNSLTLIKKFKSDIALGRLGEPKDIAGAAFFLCSEENSFITGQTIVADGGYIIGGFQE